MKERLKQASFMLFCIGTTFVATSVIFDILIDYNKNSSMKYIWTILSAFSKSLGISCFVNTIMSFIKLREESTKTLAENKLIEYMKEGEKQELRTQLANDLIKKKGHVEDDNFYKFFENEVASLLGGCYYEYFHINIGCHIKDEYIEKYITTDFKLVNPTGKEVVDKIIFGAELQEVKGVDINKLYEIEEFVVDAKDLKEVIVKSMKVEDLRGKIDDAYSIKIKETYSFKVKKSCIVKMKTHTIVPLRDTYYSNKITKPCKDYSICFTLKNPLYELSWHNFAYMGSNGKMFEESFDGGLIVGFRGWILPDNGGVISINKK